MRSAVLAVLLAALACAGCEGRVPHPVLAVLDGDRSDGVGPLAGPSFVLRVDGNVVHWYSDSVTTDEPQWVVLTGAGSGTDQGSVLVLSADGEQLARHRVSGDAPGARHQLAVPLPARLTRVPYEGRRLFLLGTMPVQSPYSLEILEASGPRELVPRLRLWNGGAIDVRVATSGGLLAFHALNNSFRAAGEDPEAYPVVVGVLDLDATLRAADAREAIDAVAPRRDRDGAEHVGRGYLAYYRLPELAGPRHASQGAVALDGTRLRMSFERGLIYVVELRDDSVAVEATAEFRERYEARRRAGGAAPPLAEHLAALAAGVRSFHPAR